MKKNSIDRSEFYGKSLDDLDAVRQEIEEGLRGAADNAALANSMPGQKLVKRLTADLDAIRRKYAGIKGPFEEQLMMLHKLQGREQQLSEELENLTSASRVQRLLGLRQEAVAAAIEDKKHEGPPTR
jgi:uncharacterized protein YicC (UPF0701 family)